MEYNFATLFTTLNEEYVIYLSLFHFPYYLSKEQQEGCGSTSGQIPPTSGSFHWLNWDPYMTFM